MSTNGEGAGAGDLGRYGPESETRRWQTVERGQVLDDRDVGAEQDRVHRPATVVGRVDVQRVDADACRLGAHQRLGRCLGQVRVVDRVALGAEVPRVIGPHEHRTAGASDQVAVVEIDRRRPTAIEADAGHVGDALERQLGQIVAGRVPVERNVEIRPGVRADVHHPDLECHARPVELLRRLAREMRVDRGHGQPRIGLHPVADRVAQIDEGPLARHDIEPADSFGRPQGRTAHESGRTGRGTQRRHLHTVRMAADDNAETNERTDFVRELVERDNQDGTFGGRVQTRFPPEPNGYLHIGHAKAINLDFELAAESGGRCILRFDDTNPDTEDTSFVEGIIGDLKWLGYEPDEVRYASDYFEQLYEWAELLITDGKAYVDEQDLDTIREQRGGYGKPGVESPHRDRPAEESLDLLRRMRDGEFDEGTMVLRARIDMQHENMQLRDPVMYRIRRAHHHRTGDRWAIYPTYDWAHGQSDAIEGTTHSLCTLEFDSHRPLYDWYLEQLPLPHDQPRQTEFARLELTHTVTSKRKLAQLVADGVVDGWDDPRLPTLRALRRRGYPPESIREFCSFIGVARTNSRHQIELLESFVRTRLNAVAQRRMAVLRPLRLSITNWPNDADGNPVVEHFEVVNNPENDADGTRQVAFSGELWIERDDFMVDPPKKFFRLGPGREVRLRGAYFVTATGYETDDDGNVTRVLATFDPDTKGGSAPDGRKVKSTMHWVSAAHAVDVQVALYERLFSAEVPGDTTGEPFDDLDRDSRELLTDARAEAALAETAPGEVVQFERLGYFAHDPRTPTLFHRTVGLRDEWANLQKRNG